MPFYGFGTLHVVPVYAIGSPGPAEGSAVPVNIPARDAFRSVFLWLVLRTLLFRKANWNRQGWTLVLVLGAIFLVLHAAESQVNACIAFYWDRYASAILFEMLRILAGAMAVLFALSDLLTVRRRWLRFPLVFLILILTERICHNSRIARILDTWPR